MKQLNDSPWFELGEDMGEEHGTHTVYNEGGMVDVVKEWFKLRTPKERSTHFIDIWHMDKHQTPQVGRSLESFDFFEVQPVRGYNANGDIATRYQDAIDFEVEFEDGDLVLAWSVYGGEKEGHREHLADYKTAEEAEEAEKWFSKFRTEARRYYD